MKTKIIPEIVAGKMNSITLAVLRSPPTRPLLAPLSALV